MKYILIAVLAVLPTGFSYADESDDAVFEQTSYNFGDYKETAPSNTSSYGGFENKTSHHDTTLSTTEVASVAGPAPASEDEQIDELSSKEVSARTQEGFAAANGALPADDGSVSVNLRRK